MQVFVTGATGYIGSAVVRELINAGHHVVGLARSSNGSEMLNKIGAAVHLGTLEDLDSLHSGAAAADGVIHLAFKHEEGLSNFANSLKIDLTRRRDDGSGARGFRQAIRNHQS